MNNLNITSLPINLDSFGFVTRELNNGKTIRNRCGRDFMYYVLHYYYPNIYNPNNLNPLSIEKSGIFGIQLPSWLIWTGLSFYKIPKLFSSLNLELEINSKRIKSFFDFNQALLFIKPKPIQESLEMIRNAIDDGNACGIDIGVSLGGLVDHVMFVYGYDDNNLYVFDTNKVEQIDYEKITDDNRYIMRLSFKEIEKRWTRFNRVWVVRKN